MADRVAQAIRRRHRPGDRLPTAVDLARRYSVSPVTMHRALRRLADAGVVTRHRRAGTFVATPPGPRRHLLGLMIEAPRSGFAHVGYLRELFIGLGLAALERQADVRLLPDWDRRDPAEALDPRAWEQLEGLAILGPFAGRWLQQSAHAIPIVLADAAEPTPLATTVRVDHAPVMRAVLDHLLALGHRRIGYTGITYIQRDPEFRCPRYDAFLDQVHGDSRIEFHPEWAVNVRRFAHAGFAMQRILALPADQRPTAILSRDMAWGLIHAMRTCGLTPGRDLSVVSLSHIEPWEQWVRCGRLLGDRLPWMYAPGKLADRLLDDTPAFSGIVPAAGAWDAQAIGRAAVEEICRRWDDPSLGPSDRRVSDFHFSRGNTTGPPPA